MHSGQIKGIARAMAREQSGWALEGLPPEAMVSVEVEGTAIINPWLSPCGRFDAIPSNRIIDDFIDEMASKIRKRLETAHDLGDASVTPGCWRMQAEDLIIEHRWVLHPEHEGLDHA